MGTKAGTTYAISTTTISNALDQAGYEALSFVELPDFGAFPRYGKREEIAEYPTKNGVKKGKGAPNYGGGDAECEYEPDHAGLEAMRQRAQGKSKAVIRVTHGDATGSNTGDMSATVDYLDVVIGGPDYPDGADSDMEREVFTLGVESVLRVQPSAIS